jgi:hypothetical protein
MGSRTEEKVIRSICFEIKVRGLKRIGSAQIKAGR